MKKFFLVLSLSLLVMLSVLLLFSLSTPVFASDFPANPLVKTGYNLDFQDEFSSGTTLDTTKWVPYYLPHWSTLALASPDYTIANGNLTLKIEQNSAPWCPTYDGDTRISGIMTGEKSGLHNWTGTNTVVTNMPRTETYVTQYGYFEIRAKIQRGGGIHSAWWMIGMEDTDQQKAELDCFEILGNNPNTISSTLHPWSDPNITYDTVSYATGKDLANEFHVYAIDWYPGGIDFYFDNVKYKHTNTSPNYKMLSMLCLYEKRASSWTGPFDATVPYPKQFQIDYFRAYKKVQDTSNLALTATAATTSTGSTQYPVANVKDGYDTSAYQSATSPALPAYVTLTWPTGQTFDTVDLKAWYSASQAPKNWDIEVSTDGSTGWTKVASSGTVSWAKSDATVETKRISFSQVTNKKGVRIKIISANLQWNVFAINELGVYKLDLPPTPPTPIATTTFTSGQSLNISNIVDGIDTNSWASNQSPVFPSYITVDYGISKTIGTVTLVTHYGVGQGLTNVDVEYYNGSTWVTAVSNKSITWNTNTDAEESRDIVLPTQISSTQIRIKVNNANRQWGNIALNELKVR